MMLTLFMLLQDLPDTGSIVGHYEKISNPILAILIGVLLVFIYFLYKQGTAKDVYIKELNSLILDHSVKNIEIIKGLQNSIDIDSANHKALEGLARENNNLLQTIMRDMKN